jgi:hypothetical protein
MGWTHKEELVVILQDGAVAVYSIFGAVMMMMMMMMMMDDDVDDDDDDDDDVDACLLCPVLSGERLECPGLAPSLLPEGSPRKIIEAQASHPGCQLTYRAWCSCTIPKYTNLMKSIEI